MSQASRERICRARERFKENFELLEKEVIVTSLDSDFHLAVVDLLAEIALSLNEMDSGA